jgi:hypothetical protein
MPGLDRDEVKGAWARKPRRSYLDHKDHVERVLMRLLEWTDLDAEESTEALYDSCHAELGPYRNKRKLLALAREARDRMYPWWTDEREAVFQWLREQIEADSSLSETELTNRLWGMKVIGIIWEGIRRHVRTMLWQIYDAEAREGELTDLLMALDRREKISINNPWLARKLYRMWKEENADSGLDLDIKQRRSFRISLEPQDIESISPHLAPWAEDEVDRIKGKYRGRKRQDVQKTESQSDD